MKIKSIKEVKPRTVYAVQTTSGTYIADGLAHHNCVGCNMFKAGEQYLYSKALDEKYGKGTAEELMSQRFQTHKLTIPELEQIIHDSDEYVKYALEHQELYRP